MGDHQKHSPEQEHKKKPVTEKTKMAFYIYEQPAFSMEHFHPKLSQPMRIQSRPRYWNLLENLFEQDSMSLESGHYFCKNKSLEKSEEKSSSSKEQESKSGVEVDKNNEANKAMEPVTKKNSKQFMFRVSCQEDMDGVKIKIQFHGHKFNAENLDVQVINDDILVVKAEDDEEKFEKKFKLSSNVAFDKIESKFDIKEENMQTLDINIPKDVEKFQVPISMEE